MIFWNDDKKGRILTSGVRFSESARSIFSLSGYRKKRVIEKGWNFERNSVFLVHQEKTSEFRLGDAFFGISEVDFLPLGYRIKELSKTD